MSVLLDVTGLEAWYGRARVLRGLSFSVASGEALVLFGRNGAGKSTTMKSLIGLLPHVVGQATFDGGPILGLPPHRIAQRGIGYVPEERRIFGDLTVWENLDVARRTARTGQEPWTEARVFELFPRLGSLRDRLGARMSGGEQQMLAVARTLMGNPRLLLLDEPSEGLAPLIVDQMRTAISALKSNGIALLLAEQNLHFALGLADRISVVDRGRIVWSGAAACVSRDSLYAGIKQVGLSTQG